MSEPTIEQLAKFCELSARWSALEAEALSLATETYRLHEQIVAWMTSNGTKSCNLHRYSLELVPGQARPNWQQEFMRVAGAAAATLVQESAERGEQLKVLKPDEASKAPHPQPLSPSTGRGETRSIQQASK